jgi:Cellulose binding domain
VNPKVIERHGQRTDYPGSRRVREPGPPAGALIRPTNQWRGSDAPPPGTATKDGWTVTFTFANGQVISQLWGGVYTQNGANATIRNESWNGTLPPNGTASIGFLASWNGANAVPAPVNCR